MTCRYLMLFLALWAAGTACSKSKLQSKKSAATVVASHMPAQGPAQMRAAVALAHLLRVRGDVRQQLAGQKVTQPGVAGASYQAGDAIITGSDGEATVGFDGKNEVSLAPNSTLVLGTSGGTHTQVGAIVLRGSVRASSGGKGKSLLIGTPAGMGEIGGAQVSVLDVSIDKGLTVQVGQISMMSPGNASRRTLSQGQSMAVAGLAIRQQTTTIDGLAIPRQDTTIDGLDLSPQSTTVDGLTVAHQSTTVDGLSVAHQSTTVDGLSLPVRQAESSANSEAEAEAKADAEAEAEAEAKSAAEAASVAFERKHKATVFVIAAPQAAEAQPSQSAPLRLVRQRTALFSGGQVRVKPAGQARIYLGSAGQLQLAGNAHFVLNKPKNRGEYLSYSVDSGSTALQLTPKAGKHVAHTVRLGDTVAQIASGVKSASADFTFEGEKSHVYLRYGKAHVADLEGIEAGQVFTVQDGKVIELPHPIEAPVMIRPGQNVEVYTLGRPLPMAFSAPASAPAGHLLVEFSRDRRFRNVLAAEEVSRTSFGVDVLPASRLFYRLNHDARTVGRIAVLPEAPDGCLTCKHDNIVQDSGKKTTLYYQDILPTVDLRWSAVVNATQYHLKIFRDGEFEHPEMDEMLTTTSKHLPQGQLGDGHYYWLVTAINKAGRNLSDGRINLLQISFDNVSQSLSIHTPKAGQQVAQSSVQTTGYIVLGSKLFINGEAIEVNKKGYFDENIALEDGVDALVYRTVGTDGKERYYSREVRRTKF